LSGGGLSEKTLQSSTLSEGYALLNAVLEGFKNMQYKTVTLLDSRLAIFKPRLFADDIHLVNTQSELIKKFKAVLQNVEYCIVIAPAARGILRYFLFLVLKAGVKSLNCEPSTTNRVCNKKSLMKKLKKESIPVPQTEILNELDGVRKARELSKEIGYPVVFKPVEAVSCEGLSLVKDPSHIPGAINKIKKIGGKECLIQEYVSGLPSSVSLITNGKEVFPLTLNYQFVNIALPSGDSAYIGGIVPFNHTLRSRAFNISKKTIDLFDGLRGYIGIDMILTKNRPLIIEVNPRLTTSYVGLKRATDSNLSEIIFDSVINGKLPQSFHISYHTFFSKISLPVVNSKSLKEISSIKDVVSPPFPLLKNKSYGLIVSRGKNIHDAIITYGKIIKTIKSF
jgi:predicted ATP-grasp superfamily ATP-dependent carboligase